MMLRPLFVVTALIFAVAAAPEAVIADGGELTLVHACVHRGGVLLRIVPPNATCRRWERALHWPAATIDANVGLGLSTRVPGQRLHIGDGNILLEGGGQTAVQFKRDFTPDPPGPSGPSPNPLFQLGRIERAGDGDPEFRVVYEDDEIRRLCPADRQECVHTVLKLDRKGIVASVKPERGSHFEAFLEPVIDAVPGPGDVEPLFRLNSFPSMQLEMGPGGDELTDVIIRREAESTMTVLTGNLSTRIVERLRIGPNGVQIVANYLRVSTLPGSAPLTSDCDSADHAGRLIVRTDGPPDLYVCVGTGGWVGK